MKQIIYLFFIIALISFGACQTNSTSSNTSEKEIVTLRLDKTAFAEKIKTLSNPKLVDVRTSEEYAEGAIDGAINLDFYRDDFETELGKLDKNQPTLIYCRSGGRSGKTLKKMREMGFQEVYELQTGYQSWKK